MAKVKLKYNGGGTYTAVITQGNKTTLFPKSIINIKACLDDNGEYGEYGIMSNDPNSILFEEKIAHIDKWDVIIEDANIIW